MREEEGWFGRLLEMLPEGWEAKAKELGAMQCAREIKTPGELLRLILLYLPKRCHLCLNISIMRWVNSSQVAMEISLWPSSPSPPPPVK